MAIPYNFVVIDPNSGFDDDSYSFLADSSPTPTSSNGFSFDLPTTITYRVTDSGGAATDHAVPTTLTFFWAQAGGGFDDGGSFSAFSGPQLYTGDAATPTFNLGGPFLYANGVTVNISAASASAVGGVPEPATWALMLAGFGMIGGTLRTRRPTRVRFG